MDLEITCPSCGAEHTVTMEYTRPEPSVGYGGGWEVEEGPGVCGLPSGTLFLSNNRCLYVFTPADREQWEEDAAREADERRWESRIADEEDKRR